MYLYIIIIACILFILYSNNLRKSMKEYREPLQFYEDINYVPDYLLEESIIALNYDTINVTRLKEDSMSLFSISDGYWIKGWNDSPSWINYGLIYSGFEFPIAGSRHPKTLEFLRSFDRDIFMAGYSILKAGSEIEQHVDEKTSTNRKNVYHIGLDVPDNCYLILDGKKIKEENNKIINFDDSISHGAVNKSNKDRLILYIKFYN